MPRQMKNAPLLLVLVLLFAACSKNNDTVTPVIPPVVPPVTDSTPAQYGTPFSSVPNRQDAIIYQVNIRAFSNQGNFAGVLARLDSIKALGVNVIYLMPIYPVGVVNSVNSPYCVKDYVDINSEFGNLSDLRALIDNAHNQGMSWIGLPTIPLGIMRGLLPTKIGTCKMQMAMWLVPPAWVGMMWHS